MRIKFISALIFTLALLGVSSVYASAFSSSYTSIKEADCKLIEFIPEGESTTQSCKGFAHFKVLVVAGDLRASVVLIRDGYEFPLNLWISNFSELGPFIEWRHERKKKKKIIAVIMRLIVNNSLDNANKTTSYLFVNKITEGEICIVAKIRPQRNQNKKARQIADKSSKLPCIE